MFKAINKFFSELRWFFCCLLRGDCKYSIKKILVFLFSAVVIFLAIFTDKAYIDLLVFIAALLGIRSWDKMKYYERQENEQQNDVNITDKG